MASRFALQIVALQIVTAASLAQSPAGNDPALVSPEIQQYSTYLGPFPPLLRGSIYQPTSVAVGNVLRLYVTENTLRDRPTANPPEIGGPPNACTFTITQPGNVYGDPGKSLRIGEHVVLYETTNSTASLRNAVPAVRIGRISPCWLTGPQNEPDSNTTSHGLGGVALRNDGRVYLSVHRTQTNTKWNLGSFTQIFLGASDDGGRTFAWRRSPVLSKSTVAGTVYSFLAPTLAASNLPGSPQRLIGVFRWGPVPGGVQRVGAIRITDTAVTGVPTPTVEVLASNNLWQVVPPGGVITFTPKDLLAGKPWLEPNDLFYNAGRGTWEMWGHYALGTEVPQGCDDDEVGSSAIGWYDFNESLTAVVGSLTTPAAPGATRNGSLGRVWPDVHRTPQGQRFVFYGSTDKACCLYFFPWKKPDPSHPGETIFDYSAFIGAEIVIREIP